MHRLDVQARVAPGGLRGVAAGGDHVGRRIDAVDIEPRRDPRHEQPTGPAGHVERRLALGHERAEVLDLGAADVEVRPPRGDQPVVPRHDVRLDDVVPHGHRRHRTEGGQAAVQLRLLVWGIGVGGGQPVVGSGLVEAARRGPGGRRAPPRRSAGRRPSDGEVVEQRQAGVGAVAHADRDRPVQLDDRRRRGDEELVVERDDAVPARAAPTSARRRGTRRSRPAARTVRARCGRPAARSAAPVDLAAPPQRAGPAPRSSAARRSAPIRASRRECWKHQQRQQPARLGLAGHELDELPGQVDGGRRQAACRRPPSSPG